MINKATKEGRIQGLKFSSSAQGLTHPFFADDTTIMTSASDAKVFEVQ
ncbi:uncharacterized protein G2W53_025117 [Senna tora]|uniref:Uncharacterized protein n=1 Tax=Senna tora TaxID=362788 RepID=A0A834TEM9_9FABA|nr:uncharacterized protein G2W53_025117 [Senna tora]